MRRFIFLLAGSALACALAASPATADNGPHQSTAAAPGTTGVVIANAGASKCAGCHRAHTAQGSYLLKTEEAGLCTTCHAGAGAGTDVMHGSDVNAGGALRGGGFATAQIGTHSATKDLLTTGRATNQVIPVIGAETTTSKHNVGEVGTIWGNGAIGSGAGTSITLECTSCHDPHGNGNYRILKPVPNDSGATADVKVPDAAAKVYTTTNYWQTGDGNVPNQTVSVTSSTGAVTNYTVDGYIANVSQWCTQCHTRYLAGSGSYKTASGDPMYLYRHRSDANYRVGGANCITCHVAHGTNATMKGTSAQVALPDGSKGNSTTDSRLLRVDDRGTCVLCHNV